MTTLTLIAVMIMGLYLFVVIRIGNHLIRQQMLLEMNGKNSDHQDGRETISVEGITTPKLYMEASRWDDYDRLHSVESPDSDRYAFFFDSSVSEDEWRMFDYRSETWMDEYTSVKRLLEEESSR